MKKGHLKRPIRSSSSSSSNNSSPPLKLKKKKLVCPSVEFEDNENIFGKNNSLFPTFQTKKEKLNILAKKLQKIEKNKKRRSNIHYDYSDHSDNSSTQSSSLDELENNENISTSRIRHDKANILKFFSFSNDIDKSEDFIENEFDDFICDEEEDEEEEKESLSSKFSSPKKTNLKKNNSNDDIEASESELSSIDEFALRREYEEIQEQKLIAIESLSFIKAFKRYIMYLSLCLMSPTFEFPFSKEAEAFLKKSKVFEQDIEERTIDFSYFQPAIDKIEKYLMGKRDQFDTKPFPNSFKELLKRYPNISHQEIEYDDENRRCQACNSYRGVNFELILDGETYNSAKLLEGDISVWYKATKRPWIGSNAFYSFEDPTTHLTSNSILPDTSDIQTHTYKNYTISSDGHLRRPSHSVSRCLIPVGSHCCKQAKSWHEMQHYKFFLLNNIYTQLSKYKVSELNSPIFVSTSLKKDKGNMLFKHFEANVISSTPSKYKRPNLFNLVPSEPLH